MPLQKLQFRPGVNREGTTLANEGGWYETEKVRFRSGYPEKLGGYVTDTGTAEATLKPPSGTYWGVCRTMWNWLLLAGNNLLGLGTNLKYYIQNGTDGYFYDVTPLRGTPPGTTATPNAFAATNGSSTLTVTDVAHGAQTGDFVTFSGAVSLGGNITATVLNSEFQITYVDANTYTVQATATANSSDVGNGGSATVAAYQITTGSDVWTFGVGWGAGPWGGTVTGVATTTLNGSITSGDTSIVLTSASGFGTSGTVLIGNELITYSGVSTNTLTGCVRGASGTTAASHSSGATVQLATSFEGWGQSASTGVALQLRLWSASNFGQNLIMNPRGGALYYWVPDTNINIWNRAQILASTNTNTQNAVTYWQTDTSCPSVCNYVLVSDSSRFVIAFGVNDYGSTTQDPMLVRWSDQESVVTWAPSATNQAGSYRLSHGSQIVTALQTRQEILVLTDTAVYSMQYLGPPYVWGFQLMGDNISIMSPNAAITVNNVTYWMGTDKFYMYTGRVETLPCALRQYIFDDINLTQAYQVISGTNEGYNEIWWFYCSANSTVIDKYVIYNHLERTWYYGSMSRTAWLDSPLRATPMAASYAPSSTINGNLAYHETGNDDGVTTPGTLLPIEAYVQSSDFDIGDGHNFGMVWRIIPDVTFDGSTSNTPSLDFTVRPRQNPGAAYGSSDSPTVASTQSYINQRTYNVQEFTQQVYVRIRGRQMAFKVSSNDLGVSWQLGAPRIDVRPDGRR